MEKKINGKIDYVQSNGVAVDAAKQRVLGSLNRCCYDSDTDELTVVGWYLPRPNRVEIWVDGCKAGEAELGKKREDVLKNYPEYNDGNSGWECQLSGLGEKPGRVYSVAVYGGEGRKKNEALRIEKRILGKIETCCYEEKTGSLTVAGWYLPAPEKVEILVDGVCLGEAELGVERKDIYSEFPGYKESCCGWTCTLEQVGSRPGAVGVRVLYGGKVEREEKAREIKDHVRGALNKCCYDSDTDELTVAGWYLPRPDQVEIWVDDCKAGEAELGKKREDVLKNYPEYNDGNSGWEYQLCGLGGKPGRVYSVAVYGGEGRKKDEAHRIEKRILGKIETCYYEEKTGSLTVAGWYLPAPEKVEILVDGVCLGEAELGVERKDIYDEFPEYKESCCGWTCTLEQVESRPGTVEVRAIYKGKVEKKECAGAIEEKIWGAINICEYNDVMDRLKINGWCLPVPQKIEIWCRDTLLGCAKLNIRRDDVWKKFARYGEINCGWEFNQSYCEEDIKNVEVKYFWSDGKIQRTVAEVTQKQYKIVSFDLFDTLVVRPVMQPTDIFKIVGARVGNQGYFKEMRILAERYARLCKPADQDDIGLNDIYERYQELYGITDYEKEHIKSVEIQVEEAYIQPRHAIKKIYEKAIKSGKRVIIVTDMYLPTAVIERILDKTGYSGYDGLYISCMENAAKGSGKMYEKLLSIYAEEDILAEDILHIGDNVHADVNAAKKYGISTFHIPKTMDFLKKGTRLHSYVRNVNTKLDNSFFVGFMANKIFDDPFVEYNSDTYCNGESKNFALIFLAPFLLEFTLWLFQNLEQDGYDTIYLAYRDGYLIEKIMVLLEPYLKSNIKTIPVYLSRAVRYNGYCRDRNGFIKAALDYRINPEMSVEKFIEKRLLVEDEELKEKCRNFLKDLCGLDNESPVGELEQLFPALKEINIIYNRNAEHNMKLIDKYCKKTFPGCEKAAIFDVGYRGSVVDFLREKYGIGVQGYQILSYSFAERHTEGATHTKSYIQYGTKLMNSIKIFHNFLEDVISIEEGTAYKIVEENGEYVAAKEAYGKKSDVIQTIQSQILESVKEFLKIFGGDIRFLELDRYTEFDLICEFMNSAGKEDAEILQKIFFVDSNFLGDINKNVYQNWYEEREEECRCAKKKNLDGSA